jgi:hypothetical protein
MTPEELFDLYFEMPQRTMKKLAADTGYSIARLKQLSMIHKWKIRIQQKLVEKDDPDFITIIIPRCDDSIAQIMRRPIIKRTKKTRECPIERLTLGPLEMVKNNVKWDEDGNVIIPEATRKFITAKIAEQDAIRESLKVLKEESRKKNVVKKREKKKLPQTPSERAAWKLKSIYGYSPDEDGVLRPPGYRKPATKKDETPSTEQKGIIRTGTITLN